MASTAVESKASAAAAKSTLWKSYKPVILLVAAIVLALIVSRLPITSLGREAQITLAVFTFVLVLWIGEVVPVGVSGLLFCVALAVVLGKRMPTSVIFSGFTNSTIWLIIGAFLLGEATVSTGLAQRIAYVTMRLGKSSYRMVLVYLWVAQVILGLLTPSGAVRVVMFIPIIVGIVNTYKAKADSKLASGLVLHVFWGMILGTTIWYTGSAINAQAMGVLKSVTGYSPSYFVYTIWNIIPCIVYAVGTFILIEWIMPAEKELVEAGNLDILDKKLAELGPMSADAWKALFFFTVAVALWATEKIHGIDTAWVALGIGGLLFVPKIGVLNVKALNNIGWDTVLLMAVALGLSDIMKFVKLDVWVTKQVLAPILDPLAAYGSAGFALGLCIVNGLIHFIAASSMGEVALVAPLVVKYAHLSGYNPALAAIVTARAECNIFIFPYQMTPLLVLMGTGYLGAKRSLRCCCITCFAYIIWIVAMSPVWSWMATHVR